MLLVDIHELDIILADAVRSIVLKHQIDDIRRILRLDSQDIIVLRRPQDLGERAKIDAERDVAVASKGRERLGTQQHGHEGDVGVVHSLQGDARVVAVEIAVLDEVLDCVDHLVPC